MNIVRTLELDKDEVNTLCDAMEIIDKITDEVTEATAMSVFEYCFERLGRDESHLIYIADIEQI